MDFGKAFSFVFDDSNWLKKLGIAGLLMIIPIIGWLAVAGWSIEVTRRVIQRDPNPLPEWSNFGDFLMGGLKVWVVGFVYALPVILVSSCQQGGTLLLQNSDSGDTVATAIGVLAICFSCITILYSIFLAMILPAAYGKLAVTGQLGAAFRFGQVFGMVRSHPQPFFICLLGSIVASIVGSLGLILCLVGAFFTYAYAMLINAHLWGQAYNVANPVQEEIQPAF
jgi:hypothetical protein